MGTESRTLHQAANELRAAWWVAISKIARPMITAWVIYASAVLPLLLILGALR